MSTISGTYNAGYSLSSSDNPVTITSTGYLNNNGGGGRALYGYDSGTPWNITNAGLIS